MQGMPFLDKMQSSSWKTPLYNSIQYTNRNFKITIFRMEMWRSMIIVIDCDHNPQKSRNFRHMSQSPR